MTIARITGDTGDRCGPLSAGRRDGCRPEGRSVALLRQRTADAGRNNLALKRAYREVIVGSRQHVALVHLVGDKQLIAARMAARKNHFMPTSLLDSQFATLEAPQDDEKPFRVAIDQQPAVMIQTIVDGLKLAR